jgi:predicted transcriptional regulator
MISSLRGMESMAKSTLRPARRSKVEIAADVLRISSVKDTTRSELMERVNLCHRQTEIYLDWLVARKLLQTVESGRNDRSYRSTPRGQTLVSMINEVQRMLAGK